MDVDEISTTPGSIMSSSKTYSTTVQTQNGLYNSYIDADFNENDSYNTIFAVLLKSSIPKILSSSAALFIITINIIWIGHHSTPSEFAGVLLALTLVHISLHVAIISLSTGLDKFFNYSYRSQLYKMVGTFIQRYILIIHLIIILLSFILYYTSHYILIYIFGQTHSNTHHACTYINILIIGFWPLCMFGILCKYIESFSTDKHNIFIFVALLIAVLLEIPFLYLLVNKYKLGIKGGAVALVITYWTSLMTLHLVTITHPNIRENIALTYPGCGHWVFNIKEMKIYLKHSMHKSIYIIFEFYMLQLFVFISGRFSTEYLAAYVISLNILQLFQRIPYGISMSSLLLIKEKLHNANGNAARRIWNVSILLNIISICVLTAVMLYFADAFGGIYTTHGGVIQNVSEAMPFMCLYFCFEGLLKCFMSGMYGLHREGLARILHVLCFYCFGFPLGIIFGFKGFLGTQLKHINGVWIGASFGILVSLCIFILIRTRINWTSEVKRSHKLLDELEIKIERFRNRVIVKYARYSNYGINSSLMEEDMAVSDTVSNRQRMLSSAQGYEWTVSDHLDHGDDSQYNYYDQYDMAENDRRTPVTSPPNYGSALRMPINAHNDFRMGPYSAASSMARSIPQSIGPPSQDNA
eukprot:75515_1